jgi:hypothetical protein
MLQTPDGNGHLELARPAAEPGSRSGFASFSRGRIGCTGAAGRGR